MVVLLIAKLCEKLLDRVLEHWGINIKRHQSSEDKLADKVSVLSDRLDEVESMVARFKEVYRVTHGLTFRAARGIRKECDNTPVDVDRILFFVDELQSIQPPEEIWGSPVAVVVESAATGAST